MSNLRSTGQLPLKTSMTNKWKAQAPSSEILERQTRALEDSLNKLKLAMHPEKAKATTDKNAPIWDKGKAGPLSQYANHVLRDEPRRVFDANKPTKIRVLGDEPPATIVRPSRVANIFNPKPATTVANKIVKCGQCEKDEAKMKCLECAESYCATCFAHFHLRGALQRHRCVSLNDSRPPTPQKKKTPVGADVIFKELRFAQSKDDFFQKSATNADSFEYNDDDMQSEDGEGGELLNGNYDEKTSAASFQQALLQWRKGDSPKNKSKKGNRSKKSKATHETGVDTVYDTNTKLNQIPMPNIEFHSSKLSYGEKLLLKKYRRANKNSQDFFTQQRTPDNITSREPSKNSQSIQVNRSLPPNINLYDSNIEIEPLYHDLPTVRAEESARTITAEENHNNNNNNNNHFDQDDDDEELMRLKYQERTKSRGSARPISRPNSSAKRKNSISSRPPSVALYQHPLPSLLATNPSDELKAITDSQPIPSRPSSAVLKKPPKIDCRLPSLWNRNWKPEQSVSDGADMKLVKIDQHAVDQFDLALNDLLDEDKIELANHSDSTNETKRPSTATKPPISARSEKAKSTNTPRSTPTLTPTPRRSSPFNFNDSPRKIDSSSSMDTGDGGFFTDIAPRNAPKSPKPPPMIQQSSTDEWKQVLKNRSARSSAEQRPMVPNLASLRKTSIENLIRAPPKRSITLDEAHQQIDEQSRPGSSLSSASLPVSITSSKPDYITRPSIERHPKLAPPPTTTTTTKKFRVEYPKKPSATLVAPPMVIEGKKVTSARNSARDSDEYLQQSMNSTRNKIPSGVQKSQHLLKTSSTSSMTTITRDDNILKDESMTITDLPLNKSMNRRSTNIDREPSKSRRMEFSVRDGPKWHQASSESTALKAVSSSGPRRSSKLNTPRPGTPSNPTNSKLAQQFSTYDNDDGRSSRACQDVEDEECFNQLRVELTSELGMTSPGWDASLSEHVLKNLRGTEVPFSEKELQENLTMLEIKLRETETVQRSQTDDDLSVHEEIRNL
ncbi:unnamed protein product [Rotaria magnacalcarata]|uniref:B box-type domain-containing protein n=3 Tax=Rotaria magnacalcarata TaxID=392030 RepID=A0A816MV01_9BILA|nr:unnamed protein product [Rotaria magnacalcarata]CAF2001693.1 unnamed protein product [Rotaria magnacalcarata]CAF3805020.1 unnamed protein product [Rotaria magnacalcarata]